MSEYEEAKNKALFEVQSDGVAYKESELLTAVIQAADKEIARIPDYQETVRLLRQERRQLDAELARLREALGDIDKLEIRLLYETCPDCYSESLGCSETKVCAQFKGRTLIQKVIDEALKSNDS